MELLDTAHGKILVMSFVDAEHAGMRFADLEFEARVSGIDLDKEMPLALLIQFDGGFILTPDSSEQTLQRSKEVTTGFRQLVEELLAQKAKP